MHCSPVRWYIFWTWNIQRLHSYQCWKILLRFSFERCRWPLKWIRNNVCHNCIHFVLLSSEMLSSFVQSLHWANVLHWGRCDWTNYSEFFASTYNMQPPTFNAIGLTSKTMSGQRVFFYYQLRLQVMKWYEDMKHSIENINSVCGGFVVIVFGASIPHFARDNIALFSSSNLWLFLDYMQYAILYLTSLTYAADASNNVSCLNHGSVEKDHALSSYRHHQMKQFKKYLAEYTKNVKSMRDTDKLAIILLEMHLARYTIGLEGYGFFTVTYEFLGSVSVCVVLWCDIKCTKMETKIPVLNM